MSGYDMHWIWSMGFTRSKKEYVGYDSAWTDLQLLAFDFFTLAPRRLSSEL